MKKLVIGFFTSVLIGSGLLLTPAGPVSAVHIVHWNMDAWTAGSRDGRVFLYAVEINSNKPLFASGNEACAVDIMRIVEYTGYRASFAKAYDGSNGRRDCYSASRNIYYNVLFHMPSLSHVDTALFRFGASLGGPGSPDAPLRNALCVKVAYIFSVSTGCTAHMTQSSAYSSANIRQINYTGFMGTLWSDGSPRLYFMGDWNRSHKHSVLDKFYNSYYEAQPRAVKDRTTRVCSGSGVIPPFGIDFIFGNKAGNPPGGSGGNRNNTDGLGFSDHCMVYRTYS